MTRSRIVSALVGVVLALGAAGCGEDEPSGSTSTGPATAEPTDTTPAAESAALDVTSVDFDFDFELDDEDLTAGTYEITLTNDGSSTHDLVVERGGEDVAESEAVDPGESTTFTVTLEEGEYVFYCSIANHRAMGMEVPVEVGA